MRSEHEFQDNYFVFEDDNLLHVIVCSKHIFNFYLPPISLAADS